MNAFNFYRLVLYSRDLFYNLIALRLGGGGGFVHIINDTLET